MVLFVWQWRSDRWFKPLNSTNKHLIINSFAPLEKNEKKNGKKTQFCFCQRKKKIYKWIDCVPPLPMAVFIRCHPTRNAITERIRQQRERTIHLRRRIHYYMERIWWVRDRDGDMNSYFTSILSLDMEWNVRNWNWSNTKRVTDLTIEDKIFERNWIIYVFQLSLYLFLFPSLFPLNTFNISCGYWNLETSQHRQWPTAVTESCSRVCLRPYVRRRIRRETMNETEIADIHLHKPLSWREKRWQCRTPSFVAVIVCTYFVVPFVSEMTALKHCTASFRHISFSSFIRFFVSLFSIALNYRATLTSTMKWWWWCDIINYTIERELRVCVCVCVHSTDCFEYIVADSFVIVQSYHHFLPSWQ